MRKHLKFAGKCALFLCILFVCVEFVFQILIPKLCYEEMLPTTLAYRNFYKMEENTIDVFFMGSSLAATTYIPQELYERYGITSYNLASEKQSPVVSYYWLKEALRYQSPKVLILDCYYFFQNNDSILNTAESSIRRALDYMRWSPVKLEAVRTICELDESQSILSYFLPNIRYHTRWEELQENDFMLEDMVDGYGLKGYAPLGVHCGIEDYVPFEEGTSDEKTDMPPLLKTYLDKICSLCEQEGIELILTNVPYPNAEVGRFNTLQNYAQEHGLQFYDFNEKSLYEASGFIMATDSYDGGHNNLWGGQKLTVYLGGVLESQYDFGGKTDEQWESTRDTYADTQRDCELIHITDIDEYIEAMQDERYSVFISGRGSYAVGLKDSTVQKLREAGLKVDLQTDSEQDDFYCYYAVLSGGETEEYIGYEEKTYRGSVRGGRLPYDISGTGSIVIDGTECSHQREGLNIVVYSNDKKKVLDSVCFNTSAEENTASR